MARKAGAALGAVVVSGGMIRLRAVGGLLGLLLVGHCWAESAPEVTFKVDPSRARIYYEATTVSSGDQQLMLGDGMPGHPLRLKDEFFKGGRDRYTLIFRDPGGDFKELSKSFGKFELKYDVRQLETPATTIKITDRYFSNIP